MSQTTNKTFIIKNDQLILDLIGEKEKFPLYTTQLMNLANQNSGGTKPRVVGQLSELIQQCPEKSYEGWKKWYLSSYPKAIEDAVEKIISMMDKLKMAISLIDKNMIKKWTKDLILEKTFIGLRFQEAILKRLATQQKTNYRLSVPEEEKRGIDGFVGKNPISIKPITYKTKRALLEKIEAQIIFYEKVKEGIRVYVN